MNPISHHNEPMVSIPSGMDCRELKFRMRDGESIVLCTAAELEYDYNRVPKLKVVKR